jgi:hypothetical protein
MMGHTKRMPGSSPGKVNGGGRFPSLTLAGLDPAIITHAELGD